MDNDFTKFIQSNLKNMSDIGKLSSNQLQTILDSQYNLLVQKLLKLITPNDYIEFSNLYINLVKFMNQLIKQYGNNKIFKVRN